MNQLQQIQVNSFLIERETAFVRIYDIEQKIEALLGKTYPFRRKSLPSDFRKPVKAQKKIAKKQLKIGKLNSDEFAFRLIYSEKGEERSEIHYQAAPLERLLPMQSDNLSIIKIETVNADLKTMRVVYG